MLALRAAEPFWLFETGPRGRSPDMASQNELLRIAMAWNEANPRIPTFVLNAFFLSQHIFIITLHEWNCFDKFLIRFLLYPYWILFDMKYLYLFFKGPQSGFIYRLLSCNEICAWYIRGPESFDMRSFYVLF